MAGGKGDKGRSASDRRCCTSVDDAAFFVGHHAACCFLTNEEPCKTVDAPNLLERLGLDLEYRLEVDHGSVANDGAKRAMTSCRIKQRFNRLGLSEVGGHDMKGALAR